MQKNPYADSITLARLLWETEMVADKYSDGGLILIRTKDGWRAFLGNLKSDFLESLEEELDRTVPSYEKGNLGYGRLPRIPSLVEELWRLLPDCMVFGDYFPEKFVQELEEKE